MVALLWYRQNALGQGAHARLMEGHVAEERVKGRQTGVSAAGAIATLFFEMVEEGAEKRDIQIVEAERGGRFCSNGASQTREAGGRCPGNWQWYEGLPAAGA